MQIARLIMAAFTSYQLFCGSNIFNSDNSAFWKLPEYYTEKGLTYFENQV